jgi:hypothetical protein
MVDMNLFRQSPFGILFSVEFISRIDEERSRKVKTEKIPATISILIHTIWALFFVTPSIPTLVHNVYRVMSPYEWQD